MIGKNTKLLEIRYIVECFGLINNSISTNSDSPLAKNFGNPLRSSKSTIPALWDGNTSVTSNGAKPELLNWYFF